MAVFCYPDGKTCIDFRGSHLIIDAASARVLFPLARVGLDIGYNSTETVIVLSSSYKQNLVEMCGAIRTALRASKTAQQFPVLQGMGEYAPKLAVNYIEANSDLHLGGGWRVWIERLWHLMKVRQLTVGMKRACILSSMS